jgi:error-prone DNA polymerase
VAVYRNKLTALSPAAKRAGLHVGQSLRAAKVNYGDTLTAGMVVAKQKPPTAKGFAFFMLEDGSTRAQLTISPQLWAEHREMLQQARILITQAYASKQGQALSLRAEQIWGFESPVASREGYAWG